MLNLKLHNWVMIQISQAHNSDHSVASYQIRNSNKHLITSSSKKVNCPSYLNNFFLFLRTFVFQYLLLFLALSFLKSFLSQCRTMTFVSELAHDTYIQNSLKILQNCQDDSQNLIRFLKKKKEKIIESGDKKCSRHYILARSRNLGVLT